MVTRTTHIISFRKNSLLTDCSTFFSSLGRILPKLCPSSSSVRTRGKVLGYSGIELLVNECHVSSGENAVSGVTAITNIDAAGDMEAFIIKKMLLLIWRNILVLIQSKDVLMSI